MKTSHLFLVMRSSRLLTHRLGTDSLCLSHLPFLPPAKQKFAACRTYVTRKLCWLPENIPARTQSSRQEPCRSEIDRGLGTAPRLVVQTLFECFRIFSDLHVSGAAPSLRSLSKRSSQPGFGFTKEICQSGDQLKRRLPPPALRARRHCQKLSLPHLSKSGAKQKWELSETRWSQKGGAQHRPRSSAERQGVCLPTAHRKTPSRTADLPAMNN